MSRPSLNPWDTSSEIIHSLLPAFLVTVLGVNELSIGITMHNETNPSAITVGGMERRPAVAGDGAFTCAAGWLRRVTTN